MSHKKHDEWSKYGNWLIEKINNRHSHKYTKLLHFLHESPFIAYLDRDEDRLEDGIMLRDEFCSENKVPIYIFDYQYCTVLEMLVALALRIDNEWNGDPGEEHPEKIFWEMLKNLKLDKFTDQKFDNDRVLEILGIWITRGFDYDGNGSIFPLKDTNRDQRNCEIWKQMQEYLSENY